MPGLGYGGHGQHFVDYGHYEEFEDLGVGPAEYGDVSLSFRGLPMVFVFAAAFVATGYYLLFVFDPRGKKRAYAETAKAQLESAWPAAKDDDDDGGGGGDGEAADPRTRAIVSCMLMNNPQGRIGGSMVFNDASGDVCLYGGLGGEGFLDEEHVYDNEDGAWVAMSQNKGGPEAPGPRAFHAMLYLGSVVLVYGGATEARRTYQGNRKVEEYDEAAYLLNLESGEWFKPDVAGAPPPARAAPALAVYKDEAVVVFGGRTVSGFANDVWKLQFPRPEDPDEAASLTWKRVNIDDPKPPGRDGHAAVIVEEQFIVFGGGDEAGGSLCPPDALEVLDLSLNTWGLVECGGEGPRAQRGLQAHAVGDAGDVCVLDGDGAGLFNDVYVLRTARDTLNWTRLALDWRSDWTMVPGTRTGHCSCANGATGTVFVFGGEDQNGVVNNALLVVDVATAVGLAENKPSKPSVWRRDS
jgi:hypothetical protein